MAHKIEGQSSKGRFVGHTLTHIEQSIQTRIERRRALDGISRLVRGSGGFAAFKIKETDLSAERSDDHLTRGKMVGYGRRGGTLLGE